MPTAEQLCRDRCSLFVCRKAVCVIWDNDQRAADPAPAEGTVDWPRHGDER